MGWANAVSWIIVLAGWAIVNRQHNNRETRKEIRSSFVDLYKLLDQIEDGAFQYHVSTGDPLLARKLKREIGQVPVRIKLAIQKRLKCPYATPLARLRRAITLENFETRDFKKKDAADPFFDEIIGAKTALIVALESAYNEAYR